MTKTQRVKLTTPSGHGKGDEVGQAGEVERCYFLVCSLN